MGGRHIVCAIEDADVFVEIALAWWCNAADVG